MRKPHVLTLVFCIGILLLLRLTYMIVNVIGISMERSIHNGEWVVIKNYWFTEPRRGDVVVFKDCPPIAPNWCIKRVIGLPSDILNITEAGTVVENGTTLNEWYVSPDLQGTPNSYHRLYVTVPADCYFVMGDDRRYSDDSRTFGFIPRAHIIGKAVFLVGSDNTGLLSDASIVFSQVHQTGVFQTSYIPDNAALLLFLPGSSFPVFCAGLFRKRTQKRFALLRRSTQPLKRMRNAWYRMGSLVLTVVVMLLFCSCSIIPQASHKKPDPSITPITASYQPARVLQFCVDTKPLFPDTLFRAAVSSVSDMLDSSVNVNEGQLQVYISYITSKSYLNDAFSFSVPAIAADSQQPTLKPLPTPGDDPYATADQLNKVKIANAQILAAWQAQLKSNHEKLAVIRAQVKLYANRLRSLPNINDATGEDVAGCLQSASERFSGSGVVNARKTLFIASPLLNMVSADSSITLSGVSVVVIMKSCALASADACIASTAAWKQRFLSFGASHVTILDPQQSQVEKLTV